MAYLVGVIQVKIDSSNKIMLVQPFNAQSERETSDGVGIYLEIGWKIYQRCHIFVFGANIFFAGGWKLNFNVKNIIGYKLCTSHYYPRKLCL